jgi:hypothetical protein
MDNSITQKGALRWLRRETAGNLLLIAILFGLASRLDGLILPCFRFSTR